MKQAFIALMAATTMRASSTAMALTAREVLGS
jgi:hypothetical protein